MNMNTDEFEIASTSNGTHFILRGLMISLDSKRKAGIMYDKKIIQNLIKALQDVEKER